MCTLLLMESFPQGVLGISGSSIVQPERTFPGCLAGLSLTSSKPWNVWLKLWFFQYSCADVRVGPQKRLSTKELMLLNYGSGEDCWESLGPQRRSNQSILKERKSTLNIHWKPWCWSWCFNTLATWCKELTHWKYSDARKDWEQEEKGATEDGMVGWHHRFNEHEFEQTLGDSEGG